MKYLIIILMLFIAFPVFSEIAGDVSIGRDGNNAEKIKVHYTAFIKALSDDLNRKILLHGLSWKECREVEG